MPSKRCTIERPFLQSVLCASGIVACSGASPAAFSAALRPGEPPPDAGLDAVSASLDAAARAPEPKAAPPLVTGIRRGDDSSAVAPEGGTSIPPAMPLAVDAAATSDSSDASADAMDAAPPAPVSCPVTFTATNVPVDGFIFQSAVLGGDADALGAWSPANTVRMSAAGGTVGVYTASVTLPNGLAVHFKFGLGDSSGQVSWESATQPTDRFLLVSCADGSVPAYTGQFNQIPDASGP